jgi:anti-sigma B factor antagonist
METVVEATPNGVAIIGFSGRLDLLSAAEAKAKMAEAVEDGHNRVVVDLADVTFMDSSGLGALVGGLKGARQAGGDLRIARATDQILSVLKLTMLDRVLRPYETIEEALAGY